MVYIMLPAYNEEGNISDVILSVWRALEKSGRKAFFLICDDGSTDRTVQQIEKLGKGIAVKLLQHDSNEGVGQAFRTLFNEAARTSHDFLSDDVFVMMESDRTSDPTLICEMVQKIEEGKDVVCASRYRKKAGYYRFPLRRMFLSVSANFALKILFPIRRIRDYTIFYRAYSSKVLRRWWLQYPSGKRIESDGFAANAEILIKLRPFLRAAEEVSLLYRYDYKKGNSKMKIIPTIYHYLIKKGLFVKLFRDTLFSRSPRFGRSVEMEPQQKESPQRS